jgi:hypothetical protein
MLFYSHESNNYFACSSSVVRWGRVLLWGPCYRRRRDWFDFGDMPYHLFHGRIPSEALVGDPLPDPAVVAQSGSRCGWLTLGRWPAQKHLACAKRNPCFDLIHL